MDVILGSSPHVLQPVDIVSVDGWDADCPVHSRAGGPHVPRSSPIPSETSRASLPTAACNSGVVLDATLRLFADGRLDIAGVEALPTRSERRRWWRRDKQTRLVRDREELSRHRRHWERLLVHTAEEAAP